MLVCDGVGTKVEDILSPIKGRRPYISVNECLSFNYNIVMNSCVILKILNTKFDV